MKDPLVLYELQYPAARITLNRPDKRNALSRDLIAALIESVTRAGDNDKVRCVLLAAAGPVFCAGMDLAELQESLNKSPETAPVWKDAMRLAQLFDLLYTLPKPTIALVQGPALAGGAGLITVCDLVLATPEARFGYPEVRRGLVAAMVMPHLLRHVGERLARYLLLTGNPIDAVTALHFGLINEVVPSIKIHDRANALVQSIAEGGPQALAKTKDFLDQLFQRTMTIEETAHGSAEPRLSRECQEGLKAFFAKKPVPWVN